MPGVRRPLASTGVFLLTLIVCELRIIFFVSSHYVERFDCSRDDTWDNLGSLHES